MGRQFNCRPNGVSNLFPLPPNTRRPAKFASFRILGCLASWLTWDCVLVGREFGPIHVSFVWSMTALLHVAGDAGADHVLPCGLAATAPWNHMIDAQQMSWENADRSTGTRGRRAPTRCGGSNGLLLRQTVECQQANHAGHLYLEVDRFDPIVFGLFGFGTQFAHLPPRIERYVANLPSVQIITSANSRQRSPKARRTSPLWTAM